MSYELKMAYLCFTIFFILIYITYKLMKDDNNEF